MNKTVKKSSIKKTAAKKSTFSDRQYVEQHPLENDIAMKDDAMYLPIDVVERDLDRWAWGTENFAWQVYRDKRGELCIGANLELVIPWTNEDGTFIVRKLTGACNFQIGSYAPNSHYVATAKSECVKNAASDLGRRFGRGLNEGFKQPTAGEIFPPHGVPKRTPDSKIRERFQKAKEEGDEATIALYSNIYEFNTQENGNENS